MTEQYVEELIKKYAEGTATNKEVRLLMEWYHLSNIDEVPWPSSDPSENVKLNRRMLGRLQKEIIPKRGRLVNFSWIRVAAILLIFLGAAFIMLYYFKPLSNSYTTITNPSGKIQLVRLPDNSKVWLNASTTLRYLNSFQTNREVKLEGEAYFEVTHDASHPFKVEADGIQTTVLGTSFNIKAYPSGTKISVSLISGKVRVANKLKNLAVLSPSDQLQFDRKSQIAITTPIDTNSVLAWKNGKMQFQGETFAEIAVVLESWYDIKIVFADPGMRNCRYYMSFYNTTPIKNILSTMSQITEMRYTFHANNKTVTLSGEECH